MKILVVHREVSVLNQIKSVLSDSETLVRFYNSGLDGLLAIRVEKFDLIICGTDLPVITGFELIRALRTHSINTITPVVFIADELSGKSAYLAKALEALGTLQRNSIDRDLGPLVTPMIREWKLIDVSGHQYKLPDN
jgi:two-component system chemotaxis response regulator CheY